MGLSSVAARGFCDVGVASESEDADSCVSDLRTAMTCGRPLVRSWEWSSAAVPVSGHDGFGSVAPTMTTLTTMTTTMTTMKCGAAADDATGDVEFVEKDS